MNSKKFLVITFSSLIIIVIVITIIVFGVVNKYYHLNLAKSTSTKTILQNHLKKSHKEKIEPFAKVSFLLGDLRVKKNKRGSWKQLTYGQYLLRGDSIRIGEDSRLEITLKSGETVTLNGFMKIRIDSSILSLNQRILPKEKVAVNSKEEGKISRLTGKEDKHKETSPVSAIRSDKPQKGKDEKTKLKTRITN